MDMIPLDLVHMMVFSFFLDRSVLYAKILSNFSKEKRRLLFCLREFQEILERISTNYNSLITEIKRNITLNTSMERQWTFRLYIWLWVYIVSTFHMWKTAFLEILFWTSLVKFSDQVFEILYSKKSKNFEILSNMSENFKKPQREFWTNNWTA